MQRAKSLGGKSEKLDLMKQEVEPYTHPETQISNISMPNQVESPRKAAQILVSKGLNGVKILDNSFLNLSKVEVTLTDQEESRYKTTGPQSVRPSTNQKSKDTPLEQKPVRL